MIPIHRYAHQSSFFDVDVFDASLPFLELLVITALSRLVGKEQRTLVPLGAIPVRMMKLLRWNHLQFLRTEGNSMSIACISRMTMLISRNRCYSSVMHACLVDIPGIKGSISSNIGGKEAQCRYG